ncbi:MAG: NADH-quinone oxidoreductase subunit C [Magnetococcales bacterium]|nr:NADH-quinone oxidoreductase subunit C [Magnetococcales bacterium]
MTETTSLHHTLPALDFLQGLQPVAHHHPWPRFRLDQAAWRDMREALARGTLSLLGLWADREEIHAAVLDHQSALLILSVVVEAGGFPSLSTQVPQAMRLERTIHDLFGHHPQAIPDERPWLDHGRWGVAQPLAEGRRVPVAPVEYPFLPVEGESLHQIPVGPVHAGIIEPGHFRFTASGETVVRLEERLGYLHRGIEQRLEGCDLLQGARLCGRISGDSTVAYALAFARAAEAATQTVPSPRSQALRGIMAEMERLANHFGDIGAICNDAAFAMLQAHFSMLREQILQIAEHCFGHRLLMDRIIPGGVTCGLTPEGSRRLSNWLKTVPNTLSKLVEVYDETPSLRDRMRNTGVLSSELARRFAAGGFVGRASARTFDARRNLPYPPYDRLDFQVPLLDSGDVNARVWIRIEEIRQSIPMLRRLLTMVEEGPLTTPLLAGGGEVREGCAVVESFRGDILLWLRLDSQNRILRCHARDPSWFQWPLLEAVVYGNIVADFPLCNKSFNCSYAGHDL